MSATCNIFLLNYFNHRADTENTNTHNDSYHCAIFLSLVQTLASIWFNGIIGCY
jgi:hypothetical protein